MKRSKFHPPADPREAERLAEHYDTGMTTEEIDAMFRCEHGTDLTERPCAECAAELKAIRQVDEHKEGLL